MKQMKKHWLAACLAVAGGSALAAGGHHSVDDAAILEPGQCELESWLVRGGGARLLHAGAGCRVGPVEIGVAGEHARQSGTPSQTGWGMEVKWATEVADKVSVGLALAPAWAAHARPRFQGYSLVGLATWSATDDLALHLNLGRDFVHRGADDNRWGLSAEFSPAKNWSLVGERYREAGAHYARAGVRWAGGEQWSLDLSRSLLLSGPGVSTWTLGATWLLERK